MARSRRGGNTLSQGLDREVHQVIRKIIDERSQYSGEPFRPSFAAIYDDIRRSNSSLNRKPRKLLEDAIERVLDVIQRDTAESDSEADLDQQLSPQPTPKPSNGMNKSIVAMWSDPNPTSNANTKANGTTTPQVVDEAAMKPVSEPPRKKRKRAPEINTDPPTHIDISDLGGVDDVVRQFCNMLNVPLLCPSATSMQSLRGILIHGPPGCGKTTIAKAIATFYGVSFIDISAPSIVSGMSGESEKALRDCFEQAKQAAPCLLFLDEIDAITPKRESASREMEKRIVAQLATLMDGLDPRLNDGKVVIVLAATNRPDALDSALRRGGRFDKEINMTVPNEVMREQILRSLTREATLSDEVDLRTIAVRTPGYVGADLKDLISTANNTAIQRFQDTLALQAATDTTIPQDLNEMQVDQPASSANHPSQTPADSVPPKQSFDGPWTLRNRAIIAYLRDHPQASLPPIAITQLDLLTSLSHVSPSALREGFATVPNTTFASIGGLSPTILTLTETIIRPILSPNLYSTLRITPSSGALLFGPPGCGKTLLARAIANASHANFIAVKGPELLNKYVGESERAVRSVFQRARSSVPCIIFFDELDALVPRREGTSSEASSRVVNTLLTELDGVGGEREGIFVVAATNRPDIIDLAVLRPGRLDNMIYVGMPDAKGRKEILMALTRDMPGVVWDERMDRLVGLHSDGSQPTGVETELCPTAGFSGADLANLRNRAGHVAVRRLHLQFGPPNTSPSNGTTGQDDLQAIPPSQIKVQVSDFETAVQEVGRSVSQVELKRYERLRKEWEHVAGGA